MPRRPPVHRPLGQPTTQQRKVAADSRRGSSTERGYTTQWRRYSAVRLKEYPLCVECERQDQCTPATVTDHIVPHRGDPQLMWDPSNHQSLCKPHHDRKTVLQDGGFGRARALPHTRQGGAHITPGGVARNSLEGSPRPSPQSNFCATDKTQGGVSINRRGSNR